MLQIISWSYYASLTLVLMSHEEGTLVGNLLSYPHTVLNLIQIAQEVCKANFHEKVVDNVYDDFCSFTKEHFKLVCDQSTLE